MLPQVTTVLCPQKKIHVAMKFIVSTAEGLKRAKMGYSEVRMPLSKVIICKRVFNKYERSTTNNKNISYNIHNYKPSLYITQPTYYLSVKGKDKAIPLQALTGPEGSRRLRLPDFKTVGT
jgi:hypothetical protein